MRTMAALPLLVFATLLFPVLAGAKSPAARRPAILDDRRVEPTVAEGNRRIGLESGVPRVLYDVGYRVDAAAPEAMARQFLRENHALLRLDDAQLDDLTERFTRRGLAGTTVRFEQRHRGIPVLGPDIAVTIDHANRVTYVANGYEPGISLATTVASVAESAARDAAIGRLGIQGELNHDVTRLVVVPEGKTARLAWQVKIVPREEPHGDWEVLVDATTGEIFRVVDTACYVNGTGFVFDPDPLSTAHTTYGSPGYTDGADATTAQLDAARASRTLLDITDLGGGTFKLQGPYATVVDSESPFKGLFTQAGSTFNFNRFADNFEAVHTYFHIDHIMRYINTTLGIAVTPYQYAGGVRFDPSGFNGADNSHYLSSTGEVAFGEGGVDDAEDADVVIHELGHGLHDWLTGGGLSQVNGLSEGFGDYVAHSYSRSLAQWLPADAQYHWVFNWDGHNEFWPGRITNYGATYPGGLVGQVHTDGQIWSTCLMRIWNDVGRNRTDAAVFEGIAMTNSGSNQNDAAQAVLQAAVAMGYTSSEINSFVTHFQTTGYDVSAGMDYVSHSIVDQCPTNPANVNAIAEPGEGIEVRVVVEAASIAQTGVVGTLTTTTPGVTILDGTASWPNLAAGVPTQSSAPHFKVVLDESVPCFADVDFDLSLTSNEGGPYPMSLAEPVGSSFTPSGLPAAIPDNAPAGVTSTLAVGTNVALTDLNVRVEITHTWVGDLFIKLRSPLGTEVTLLDRPGVPVSTFGCGNDNMNVTFDDASAFNPESHCAGTNPWFNGTARAVGLLSAFNGQSSLGNWVLTVSDNAGQDVGSVVDWELIATPALVGECDPCLGAVDAPIASSRRPAAFELAQNRPNPFSARTEFRFQLPRAGRATLGVYDVAGRLVAMLVDRELAAGPHAVTWDGSDRSGAVAASGIYFYRLTSGTDTAMQRLQLLR